MKTKRQISKEETRNLIISKTKEFVVSEGIINTTTKQIAEACGIAHGTLFSHFKSRDELFACVIKYELIRLAKLVKKIEPKSNTFFQLLEKYLTVLSDKEDFMASLYKEFPFLNDELKREMITTESIVKKFFYESIEFGIQNKELREVDIPSTLTFLFGAIQHYLIRSDIMKNDQSIIESKKQSITITMSNILKP